MNPETFSADPVIDAVSAVFMVVGALMSLGAALCIDMAVNRHLNNLMLLVSISIIGFVGSVTVARFVADRRKQPDES